LLAQTSTPRSLSASQPQLASTVGDGMFGKERGGTYADELSALASSRRNGHEKMPMRALSRASSKTRISSPAQNDGFLPSISGVANLSDPESRRDPLSPVSLPSTRSLRNGSDGEGGSATEVLKRLRASAIDRQRGDEYSPGSTTGRLGASQALQAGLAMNRARGNSSSGSTSPSIASGAGSPKGPNSSAPNLETFSIQRHLPLNTTTNSLAQRRRLLQLSKLNTEAPQAKKIRKLEEGEKIYDLYYWEEVLQEAGDGGKVVVCRPKDSPDTGFGLVMKIRSKESLRELEHEEEFLRSQLRMLNLPAHVGVMNIKEILEDEQNYYIVMDKAKGGTLFHSLVKEYKDGIMPHRAIRNLTKEILEAVAHIHSEGILHRDIKPDNLVMQLHDDPASPGGKVKKVTIIDFDHADTEFSPLSPSSRNRHCYGTARFNSPEAFLGHYSPASDLWSVGTILYLLITGNMPYPDYFFDLHEGEPKTPHSNSLWMEKVFNDMKSFPVDWSVGPFAEHPTCTEFCKKLLAFDPADRFASAEEALQHQWVASR